MNEEYKLVKDMHKIAEVPIADTPTIMPPERVRIRGEWIQKELQELYDAKTLVDQVDANIDMIYFCLGNLVEMGVYPRIPFILVHQTQLTKVWPDGTIHKTPEGKWIKPEGWEGPEKILELELKLQATEAAEIKYKQV